MTAFSYALSRDFLHRPFFAAAFFALANFRVCKHEHCGAHAPLRRESSAGLENDPFLSQRDLNMVSDFFSRTFLSNVAPCLVCRAHIITGLAEKYRAKKPASLFGMRKGVRGREAKNAM